MSKVVYIFGPSGPTEGGGIASSVREIISTGSQSWTIETINTVRHNKASYIAFLRSIVSIFLISVSRFRKKDETILIHFNIASYGSALRKFALAWLATIVRLPHVFLIHGGGFEKFYSNLPGLLQKVVKRGFDQSDGVASVSMNLASRLCSAGLFSQEEFRWIPNGVNLAENKADDFVMEARTRKQVLFVGSQTHEKGFDLFCALAENITQRSDSYIFLAAGASGSTSTSMPDSGSVISVGLLDHDNLMAELRASCCLVVSSRVEAFPMIILEAMQLRVPIIASDVGDIPIMLQNGANGLLFESGRTDQLISCFTKMESNGKLASNLVESAFQDWVLSYQSAVYVGRLEAFWDEAMAKNQR